MTSCKNNKWIPRPDIWYDVRRGDQIKHWGKKYEVVRKEQRNPLDGVCPLHGVVEYLIRVKPVK